MIEICNKIKWKSNKNQIFLHNTQLGKCQINPPQNDAIKKKKKKKERKKVMELVTTAIFESNVSLRWKEEGGEGEKKEEIGKRMKLHFLSFFRSNSE